MPMNLEQREAFLAKPRYAVITTLTGQGRPVSVPVWYEWDGRTMAMFTTPGTGKVTRLTANPFASVLVMTNLDESEAWVSMDGKVEILDQGGDDEYEDEEEESEEVGEEYEDEEEESRR